MRLNQWVETRYGMDGWWTCMQFDRAVLYLGNWVDAKLLERDQEGHQVYTLDDLLYETDANTDDAFLRLVGYADELE